MIAALAVLPLAVLAVSTLEGAAATNLVSCELAPTEMEQGLAELVTAGSLVM